VQIQGRTAKGDDIQTGQGRYPSSSIFEIDISMKITQPVIDCLILKVNRSTLVTKCGAN
jgi:hypothetical protein